MINALDLFSGIAGNSIGLREYIKTIAYCEADRHSQSVLLSRMSDGSITPAPIWDDVTTLRGDMFNVPIDIIVGGFPCQDISVAGRGAGLEGKRSGLFYEVCRLVEEIKPTFVFLENVPAIRTRGLREVLRAFTDLGYDCRWTRVSAAEVGGPHRRERWFLLAKSSGGRCSQPESGQVEFEGRTKTLSSSDIVAHTDSQRLEVKQTNGQRTDKISPVTSRSWWESEPDMGRVVNGLSFRVDRIKRLGNAVVPAQAKVAFERLLGVEINNTKTARVRQESSHE